MALILDQDSKEIIQQFLQNYCGYSDVTSTDKWSLNYCYDFFFKNKNNKKYGIEIKKRSHNFKSKLQLQYNDLMCQKDKLFGYKNQKLECVFDKINKKEIDYIGIINIYPDGYLACNANILENYWTEEHLCNRKTDVRIGGTKKIKEIKQTIHCKIKKVYKYYIYKNNNYNFELCD